MTQNNLIQTGFSFSSTADEVISGVDLTGKRAVVTGGSSGIGVETARALAAAGASVALAVRDVAAGERTAASIAGDVGVGALDLSDLSSVRAFVEAWDGPLDLLINNAGVMALPTLTLTDRGWELQFATNHVGHFALTVGLHAALASADGARVVSLSSRGHLRSPVVFDDIHYAARPYDPWTAYGQSKTANVLLAVEANRRWADAGITANAVHPGGILATNLSRHMDPELIAQYRAAEAAEQSVEVPGGAPMRFKSLEQGAATTVLVATSPLLEGVGGRYFEDCNEARHLPAEIDPAGESDGVAAYALDPEAAERLWDLSEDMIAGT